MAENKYLQKFDGSLADWSDWRFKCDAMLLGKGVKEIADKKIKGQSVDADTMKASADKLSEVYSLIVQSLSSDALLQARSADQANV